MGDRTSNFNVPGLVRGLQVLEYLSLHPNGRGQSEIAAALNCPVSSVFRITMALVEQGYLERNPKNKIFRLTHKMLNIGQRILGENDLIAEAIEPMRDLRDEVMDTVLIGVLNKAEVVVLDQVLGHHMFKFAVNPGTRAHAHASAPGKAIVAFLPEREREALLKRISFTKFNGNTITTLAGFRKELAKVANCGYAIDRGEEFSGIYCIGAPVFDRYGYPVAAIWVTGPEAHAAPADYSRIGERVKKCARQVSLKMGHGPKEIS